jgi:heavy metal sensor kinase
MSRLRSTLRLRLTIWYAAVLLAVLVVYAGVVFAFLEHSLWQQLDQRLHEDVEDMEALLPASWSSAAQLEHLHSPELDDEEETWVEVWSLGGTRLYQSPRAARFPVPVEPPRAARLRSVLTAGQRHVRIKDERSHIGGEPVIIRVTASEERLRGALVQMLWIMALGIPIALAGATYGGYRLARRALGPVDRMAERARTITAERLAERLPVENPDDEIGRLATVFNEMFARLEAQFEQMRRFTADASHELRTPLTAIRAVGEVALREGRNDTEYREVIGSLLEEADHVTRLVETLLMLSRADAGQIQITRQDVDLAALAHQVTGQLEVLAEEKHQSLSVEAAQAVQARVDPLVLRLALVNLVDNAIHYSPSGARITVRIWTTPTETMIDVEDNGPGIAAVHHPHLFDRFYRIDGARTRQDGGVGLGLAITRWAVEVQNGRIEVLSEEGEGSVFRIRLPRDHERTQVDTSTASTVASSRLSR